MAAWNSAMVAKAVTPVLAPATMPIDMNETVTKFNVPDLNTHGAWLLERLRKRYPHVTDQRIAGWLRCMIGTHTALFIKATDTVGLAVIGDSSAFDVRPIVEEVFVYSAPDADRGRGCLIYKRFLAWARSMNAAELRVEADTDVPRELVQQIVGRVRKRDQAYVEIKL